MQHKIFSLALLTALVFSCSVQKDFQGAVHEDFNKPDPKYFGFHTGGLGADFTRAFGIESPSEPGTSIMLFRIDPEDRAGAGRGPEIISNDFTHFGTYAARLKVPDVKSIQPNVGAVVGYFTYHMDSLQGLSEIDVEWLIADPTVIYVGTWTGPRGNLKRIGRSLNLAEGKIYSTTYREGHEGERSDLTGEQNVPETIPVIDGYDASARFYTYGFDWHPDRIRWWMIHPVKADTVVLWDYSGSLRGIPQHASRYRLNFWHTNNWSVETNPNSVEKPHQPYELEVDWMSYTPLKATE